MPNQSEVQIQDIYIQGEIDMLLLKSKIRVQEVEREYLKEINKIKASMFNKAIKNGIHPRVILSLLI